MGRWQVLQEQQLALGLWEFQVGDGQSAPKVLLWSPGDRHLFWAYEDAVTRLAGAPVGVDSPAGARTAARVFVERLNEDLIGALAP